MNIRDEVSKSKHGGSMESSDIYGEERLEDAKNEAALVEEELRVGVGKRKNNERAAKNERKIFNKRPQL